MEPTQSHYVSAESQSNSFSNPFHIRYSPRTTAHERKESGLQIRSMGLCQKQKSLGHEQSKLCNIQKKGKFP